jgi:RNA polymerase sigma factor (sigma-70 family)
MTIASRDPSLEGEVARRTDVTDLTDTQLLDRFISRHDEAAFAALLHRHGPLVLGVCRRVLRDAQDAEDAFQATFLVLVRNAASITKRQSVRSWLYGVAYRIAVKARKRSRRRDTPTRQAVNRSPADPVDEILWRELRPVLDEEIHRLPEKYRAPVVLCYLEGMSYAEAAAELGCSKATIALRLEWARVRLRDRLSRRDVTLSIALFPLLLTPDRTRVAVPASLEAATARAAFLWATGGTAAGAVSVSVTALTGGVLSGLVWSKWKIAMLLVLAAAVTAGGAGLLQYQTPDAGSPAVKVAPGSGKPGKKPRELRKAGFPQ